MKHQRLRRVQEQLDGQDFDCFVSSSAATVEYVCGFRSMASRLYEDSEVFVVVGPSTYVIALPFGQAAAALDSGVDPTQIVAFGPFSYYGDSSHPVHSVTRTTTLTEALRQAIALVGPGARYGLEYTRLSVAGLRAIEDALELRSEIDATRWIAGVRSVKTPEEVSLLRRAAEISQFAIAAALDSAREGSTEDEIAGVIADTMLAGGGQPAFLSIQTGARAALGDAYPSRKAWKRGEFLRIDTGCIVEGYWSDIARTAYLGCPTREQERVFNALRIGQQHELDTVRPGITARELFRGTRTAIRESGFPDFERHHCGHGIGLSIYDSPHITSLDDTELEAGMVLCLETPYYAMNEGGVLTEDTVVVTEGGCESFTTLSRELRIC